MSAALRYAMPPRLGCLQALSTKDQITPGLSLQLDKSRGSLHDVSKEIQVTDTVEALMGRYDFYASLFDDGIFDPCTETKYLDTFTSYAGGDDQNGQYIQSVLYRLIGRRCVPHFCYRSLQALVK